MSRFRVFLVISAVLIAVVVVTAGFLVGRFFERHVVAQEEAQTAEMVQNQARQHLTARDFDSVAAAQAATFQVFLEGLPGVFRIKAFNQTGRIVWSNEPRLIGRMFPDNPYLLAALGGRVTMVLEAPRRAEHVFEQERGYLAEAYVPIAFPGSAEVVGVIETYKDMTAVAREIGSTQRQIWAVGAAMGLFLYVALAVVVWKASASELRAISRLEEQNQELTLLQQFTQSVLRPLDLGQVAASVVESAGTGLNLSAAALYRVEPGGELALLAGWPTGSQMPTPSTELAPEAVATQQRVLRDGMVAIPVLAQRGTAHLFLGRFGGRGARPAAAWRTLEIMLQEASIALANVELFTEIREAHEHLAAILAGVADQMVIVDREMRVVWTNAAAAAVVGEGAVGRTCFELIGAAGEACESCPAVRTLLSGTVERGVRARPGPGGKTTYLDLITAPLRDASGAVYQVLEVSRDITELVEMEERLKQSNQALLDAQAQLVEKERLAAVGQVVVGLHHSILNPLTGILGALQVVKQTSPGAPEQARAIAEAEDQVRKIERLVKHLPDLQSTTMTAYVGKTTMLDLDPSRGEAPASGGKPE